MPRLVHPTAGTVVEVGDSLESRYRAAGWAEESARQDEAPSEKPKPVSRRKSSK
jgi:hypothetical protein